MLNCINGPDFSAILYLQSLRCGFAGSATKEKYYFPALSLEFGYVACFGS